MTVGTKEHYELLAQFEREFRKRWSGRLDKEAKELWARGAIYQNGEVNQSFLAFQLGYAFGKAVASE